MRDPKDIVINGRQLSDILEAHKIWLTTEATEGHANLTGADLRDAVLTGALLMRADLMRAHLRGAHLRDADLRGADLTDADLMRADLRGAHLMCAHLRDADLRDADLTDADLTGADLTYADLRGAHLTGAKNAQLAIARVTIVPEGDIVGWKKCRNGVIVKLLIPVAARRSNASGRKCRAEYAKVLEVIGAEFGQTNQYGSETIYKVGETVRPDKWDDDRWNECSNGIHFFITREEAEAF